MKLAKITVKFTRKQVREMIVFLKENPDAKEVVETLEKALADFDEAHEF